MTNVGVSVGALGAGWAVQVGTVTSYRLLVVGLSVSWAAAALVLLALPPVAPGAAAGDPRRAALRDRPYLLLTALDGVTAVQFKVLTVAVPLWLIGATAAPRWLVSGTMLTCTVIVVAFQVRASRGVDSPAAGGRAYRRAGLAFLLSCSLIPLAAGVPVLLGAVVVHTVGELWHAAAGFEVSFGLAPERATGQYLGVFGTGAGLAEAFGPGLLIWLRIDWGRPGWYVLGALFAVTGLAVPPAVRWAGRHGTAAGPERVPLAAAS